MHSESLAGNRAQLSREENSVPATPQIVSQVPSHGQQKDHVAHCELQVESPGGPSRFARELMPEEV